MRAGGGVGKIHAQKNLYSNPRHTRTVARQHGTTSNISMISCSGQSLVACATTRFVEALGHQGWGSAHETWRSRHRRGRVTARASRILAAIMLAGACALSSAQPGAAIVKLATLDWPPYTGQNLDGLGESTKVVRAAFDAAGHTLHPRFYPWSRAISESYLKGYVGYYPEYASSSTKKACLLAGPIGSSRLGFAHKHTRALKWNTVSDLSRYRIGVVRNYVNSEELDAAISTGQQPTDQANDDAQNIRKLIAGRIDLAVIDAAVLAHLMKIDATLKPHRGEIVFAERSLETKNLYVCFWNNPAGRFARDRFNTGLRKIGVVGTSPVLSH